MGVAASTVRMVADKPEVHGFAPISLADARVLVLGTMPGVASLRLQQYYGHPQNGFWRIVGAVLGFDAHDSYAQRCAALVERQVALWDVLATCTRTGSLDSDIDHGSLVPNAFAVFFEQHAQIERVCFNGAKAHSLYRKHVLPFVAATRQLELVRLPSTSPAHAGMPFADKVKAWRVVGAPS